MAGEPEYRDALLQGPVRGRGAGLNPGNRFEPTRLHVSGDFLDEQAREDSIKNPKSKITNFSTTVLPDQARTIINEVDHRVSPDIPFRWTINPYRGCEHGCIYCYARPYHEFLGFSCGLDFETKIMAKFDAPKMLRRELAASSWEGQPIAFSGATDCYQPLEAQLKLTRGCLEVMAQCCQPVTITTKNRLVLRDLDLLTELAAHHAVHVSLSLSTLDNQLASKLEPRASSPRQRLAAIRKLADAGVPVSVMTAPIIPGLTDRELPQVLKAAAEAGAKSAGYQLLRLPMQVKDLFLDWLRRHYPDRAQHVEMLIRQTRDGRLNDCVTYAGVPGKAAARRRQRPDRKPTSDCDGGNRFLGEGAVARQIHQIFETFVRRYGLNEYDRTPLSSADFRRPNLDGQMALF